MKLSPIVHSTGETETWIEAGRTFKGGSDPNMRAKTGRGSQTECLALGLHLVHLVLGNQPADQPVVVVEGPRHELRDGGPQVGAAPAGLLFTTGNTHSPDLPLIKGAHLKSGIIKKTVPGPGA